MLRSFHKYSKRRVHTPIHLYSECTWGGQFADYVTAFFAPLQRIRLRCDTHFVQHTGKFQPQRSSAAFRQQFHPTEAMRTASCHGHSIHWNVASLCSDRPILRNRKTVGICAMRIRPAPHEAERFTYGLHPLRRCCKPEQNILLPIHPFTAPAVMPEMICFCARK